MATFKICVRKKRNDGFYPVYIRVIQNKKVGYIKTDKLVNEAGLSKGEVSDPFVVQLLMTRIVKYVERINRVESSQWSLQEVIEYVQKDSQDVSFSEYARIHIGRMINRGQERNARNYTLATEHLERYLGTTNVMFSTLTSTVVNSWIESLSHTHRAKEMYPVCVRQIYREAIKEYNDYDRDVIRIKVNPWMKVQIPQSDKSEQLAITPQDCRVFFNCPLPESKMASPLPDLGRDVAKLILCLGGINTIDLYQLQKKDYYDGIIHYCRAKTKKSRADNAYIEMRVPPIIQPLFDKYRASDDDEYLFSFHKRHTTPDSFGANCNIGIKAICKSLDIPKDQQYCCYTFRHTWATIAQNDVGATLEQVAFAMNHSNGRTVTRGYVKLDFSPAWELNEKVTDLIFFSDVESHREYHQESFSFEKFSKKQLMKGTVYFRGKTLGEVHDIGFSNKDEIIQALLKYIPEDLPKGCIVQFKVENCDKQQVAIYERQKGKGFD